ncbi:TPA: hypothetical protein QDA88_000769 [Burkholderia vietnamiensis]|nr:hypothetical protein [Burkholderia vietnamiensis]
MGRMLRGFEALRIIRTQPISRVLMDVHLKNAAAIIFLILTNFPWFVSPLYAQNIKFNDGMEVRLPAYKNRRSNPDGSDSVCVDVHWLKIMATICLCSKTSEKIAQENGFARYGDLSPQGRSRISPIPDDALVCLERGIVRSMK